MADYRDPKVTNTTAKSSPMKWLWIALGVIVLLLLLSWLFGLFDNDVETVEGEAVIVEEVEVEEVEPVAPAN